MNTVSNNTSTVKGHIRISSTSHYAVYEITNVTNNTGWWTLTITYTTSNSNFSLWDDQDKLQISVIINGDRGSDGEKGEKGQKWREKVKKDLKVLLDFKEMMGILV